MLVCTINYEALREKVYQERKNKEIIMYSMWIEIHQH